MPPKKGGKGKKQNDDQEFDALMKQLSKSTAQKGKEDAKKRANEKPAMSIAERKAAFQEREKAKEEAVAKSLEQRAQQRKLQDMLREMMSRQSAGFSPFLEEPATDVSTENVSAKGSKLNAACATMQGWRRAMEDADILRPNFIKAASKEQEDTHLFAVMDGHGGDQVAKTVKVLLPGALMQEIDAAKSITDEALIKAFSKVDGALKKQGDAVQTCGCTCVTTLITHDNIICASVGDSRAVLARKPTADDDGVVTLAFDHKPENDAERVRIEAANGHVENNRVNGQLAMSRALGDFTYKGVAGKSETEQQVSCLPEIHRAPRKQDDQFLVVACDGIFDVLENADLVKLVREEMQKIAKDRRLTNAELETVAGNVTKFCLAPMSPEGRGPARAAGTDNMSIAIVQL